MSTSDGMPVSSMNFPELLDLMVNTYHMGYSISYYPDGSIVHAFVPTALFERQHVQERIGELMAMLANTQKETIDDNTSSRE